MKVAAGWREWCQRGTVLLISAGVFASCSTSGGSGVSAKRQLTNPSSTAPSTTVPATTTTLNPNASRIAALIAEGMALQAISNVDQVDLIKSEVNLAGVQGGLLEKCSQEQTLDNAAKAALAGETDASVRDLANKAFAELDKGWTDCLAMRGQMSDNGSTPLSESESELVQATVQLAGLDFRSAIDQINGKVTALGYTGPAVGPPPAGGLAVSILLKQPVSGLTITSPCSGTGDKKDMVKGAQVIVQDDAGKILDTTTLSGGTLVGLPGTANTGCLFLAVTQRLPPSSFYQLLTNARRLGVVPAKDATARSGIVNIEVS